MGRAKGFTLIELLITVTILMILSAFVYVTVGNSQKAARDNQKVAHANNLMAALDQYASSNFRKYPTVSSCATSYCSQEITSGSSVYTALTPYINPVPTGSGDSKYYYVANYDAVSGTSFKQAAVVISQFELGKNNNPTSAGGKCNTEGATLPTYLNVFMTDNLSSVCYHVAR